MYLVWNASKHDTLHDAVKAADFTLESSRPPHLSQGLGQLFNYHPAFVDLSDTILVCRQGATPSACFTSGQWVLMAPADYVKVTGLGSTLGFKFPIDSTEHTEKVLQDWLDTCRILAKGGRVE